jgi:hypothetical protein
LTDERRKDPLHAPLAPMTPGSSAVGRPTAPAQPASWARVCWSTGMEPRSGVARRRSQTQGRCRVSPRTICGLAPITPRPTVRPSTIGTARRSPPLPLRSPDRSTRSAARRRTTSGPSDKRPGTTTARAGRRSIAQARLRSKHWPSLLRATFGQPVPTSTPIKPSFCTATERAGRATLPILRCGRSGRTAPPTPSPSRTIISIAGTAAHGIRGSF